MKVIRTATVALSLDLLLKGQLAFLKQKHEVIAVSGADSHLENLAKREGVQVIDLPMQRAIRPIHDLHSLVRLYFMLKRERPQLVHSITPKAGLLTMTAAWLAGVPIRIHTFTGLIFPYRKGILFYVLRFMDQCICRFATHVIAEGQGVKSLLETHKITRKPIRLLAHGNVNGIDSNYFDPETLSETQAEIRTRYAIPEEAVVYVFIGRLVSDKGIVELVEAFLDLYATQPQAHLLLVGPMESELDPIPSAILTTIATHPAIQAVGYQSDVRLFLKMSDALVLPSYREGFPNVILQAGAMGLPCIVTDIPGCNEVIQPGKNGWIVPVKDRKELSLALNEMANDRAAWRKKHSFIREQIITRFTHVIVWSALDIFYEQCQKELNVFPRS